MAKKASLIQKLDEWLPISYEICKAEQVNRVRVKKLVILNRLEICSVGSNSIFFHTEIFFFKIFSVKCINLDLSTIRKNSYQQIETC